MSIELLLSRVTKLKPNGHGAWRGCCPAHDGTNPSALSIRHLSDGRILINCFAGCSTEVVIDALGLEWADIMPPSVGHKFPSVKPRVYSTDALKAIQFEARIVCVAAFEMLRGAVPNQDDIERLKIAMDRINTAVEMSNV